MNFSYSFQSSYAIETGLFDFHKMTVAVMKVIFHKNESKISQLQKLKVGVLWVLKREPSFWIYQRKVLMETL